MKAFDLDLYNQLVKEDKTPKLVTRNGKSVRLVCVDRNSAPFTILGLVDETTREIVAAYTKEGYFQDRPGSDLDLFFADTEPTYRPYKDAEECLKDVRQHGFLIRAKRAKVYHLIVTITSSHIWLGGAHEGIPMDRLLDEFEYISGQPCGVKEE